MWCRSIPNRFGNDPISRDRYSVLFDRPYLFVPLNDQKVRKKCPKCLLFSFPALSRVKSSLEITIDKQLKKYVFFSFPACKWALDRKTLFFWNLLYEYDFFVIFNRYQRGYPMAFGRFSMFSNSLCDMAPQMGVRGHGLWKPDPANRTLCFL